MAGRRAFSPGRPEGEGEDEEDVKEVHLKFSARWQAGGLSHLYNLDDHAEGEGEGEHNEEEREEGDEVSTDPRTLRAF
jgi:hypothetical protein